MDITHEIRRAVETGKVLIGTEECLNALKNKNVKLIICAENIPEDTAEDIEYYCKLLEVPFYKFKGSSMELGTVVGKPYVVSVIAVISPGESNILSIDSK
ncbi:MAG TPA: 50S ribosomal protein L30e [Methanomicrobia archaeon]|nr:MAG: 50S ribosomal protein L30e [Thermococci archaeon]RLF95930.1 MAG: 50S ribosomal protein L30e [Thermococci archaeon]RLF98349.1 MAG: 50S ribosomal protein L30e [Thermococci archaeon]HDN82060.1 50S ribosomal protein L30e [Methanomicrobia archaeon]HEC88042.1 50S ribosomal protein L30e [Thermoplasmata archaeon]